MWSMNGFRGIYRDFDDAMRHVPKRASVGYDNPETASFYRDRLDAVQHDDYPVLFWFEKALKDSHSVVEVGGHVGVAYYSFERLIRYPEDLHWLIVDVPAVTAAGEQLARQRDRTQLSFANAMPEGATRCDILMASGSLQYLPDPMFPERVFRMDPLPRHILIHKTPVSQGEGFLTLQNIGAAICPYRIYSYGQLVTPLLERGYELVDTWRKDRRVMVPGHPELKVEHYSGYYLRRRAGSA
jgi:putative methyltransferase (TIGR04325 family)